MTRLGKLYDSSMGHTGMSARVFVSFSVVTLLLVGLLVACGGSEDPTAVATATLSNASSSPASAASTATSAAPSASASASPLLPRPSASAQPSAGGPAASAAPSASASAGAVAATDGACPATHPVKAGQLGPAKSYAVSGDTSYDRMRATECFATEAEAEAAGYRKAAR